MSAAESKSSNDTTAINLGGCRFRLIGITDKYFKYDECDKDGFPIQGMYKKLGNVYVRKEAIAKARGQKPNENVNPPTFITIPSILIS